MVGTVIAQFGRIGILVNNAGVMHVQPFAESTEESRQDEIDVNILGPLRLTCTVLPHMIAQRYGKIINLSSQLALVGWDRAAVYAGSKCFILTWTNSLAREVGECALFLASDTGSYLTGQMHGSNAGKMM
jgi:short-subunit dehydrogenase